MRTITGLLALAFGMTLATACVPAPCASGLERQGGVCVSVDPCAGGPADCTDPVTDPLGPYGYGCEEGFEPDGEACVDIDECAEGLDGCDIDASCTNIEGAYECQCLDGFRGDGFVCEPICGPFEGTPDSPSSGFPQTLTETGCFLDVPARVPVEAALPYAINSVLWTDGASKQRHVVLPEPDSVIGYREVGSWDLPVGSIVIKEFLYEGQDEVGAPRTIPLETRFLIRRALDRYRWEGYSYGWACRSDKRLYVHSAELGA